jgi:NCS1 family nucleobase:cation symporter-1
MQQEDPLPLSRIERRSIDVIPDAERHGSPINYYLISRERVDVPALYDPDARYGRWNRVALVSYTIGVLAQIPFMAQALYTGPIAEALGGADISWLVGLAVTAAVYYPWAKRTTDVPPEMIYPAGTVAAR